MVAQLAITCWPPYPVHVEGTEPSPAAPPEHVVQLFDEARTLGETVGAFLSGPARAGHPLLVVARLGNLRQIARALEASGLSVPRAIEHGQITLLDAEDVLSELLVNDGPDPARFDALVGAAVRRLTKDAGRRLHVYGELVEVLAEQGNYSGAVAVEDLWNGLGAGARFTLLCGYSSAHFAAPAAGSALSQVCLRHTRVGQSPDDLLAAWLLAGR